MQLIVARPGIPLGELRLAAGMGWSSIYLHVETLMRAELIRTEKVGRFRRVFARSCEDVEVADAFLRGQGARRVAEAIVAGKAREVATIAFFLGGKERVVYHHVRHLVEKGLVTSASQTRYRDLRATPELIEMMLAPDGVRSDGPLASDEI